jgi:hypothetical protein
MLSVPTLSSRLDSSSPLNLLEQTLCGLPGGSILLGTERVEIYAVATATTESRPNYPASAWIANEKFAPQVLLDDEQGTAASAYGLTGFPYLVMMDKDGKVTNRASGELPIDQFGSLVENLSSAK